MKNTIKHYRIINEAYKKIWTTQFVKSKEVINELLDNFFIQKPWLSGNFPFYISSQHDKQVVMTLTPENKNNIEQLYKETGYSENCIINSAILWAHHITLHPQQTNKSIEKFTVINKVYDFKKLEEFIINKRFSAVDVFKWFIENHLNEGYSIRSLSTVFDISHQALHKIMTNNSKSVVFELSTLKRIEYLLQINKPPRFLKPQLFRLHVAIGMAINNIPLKNLLKVFSNENNSSDTCVINLNKEDFKLFLNIIKNEYFNNRSFFLKDVLINHKNIHPGEYMYNSINFQESNEIVFTVNKELSDLINNESNDFKTTKKQYLTNTIRWFINQKDLFQHLS